MFSFCLFRSNLPFLDNISLRRPFKRKRYHVGSSQNVITLWKLSELIDHLATIVPWSIWFNAE